MKAKLQLIGLYATFAGVATIVNIGCQILSMQMYQGRLAVGLSMVMGTLAGLLVKYILDKQHVFNYQSDNLTHDSKLFALYSLMGIATTTIFWIVEYSFYWMFGTQTMRYLGGVIGLAIGYLIKYQLDKKYVFVTKATGSGAI